MVPNPRPQLAANLADRPESPCQQDSLHSDDSVLEENYQPEFEFSEDEGLMPERPGFTGLFCPSVFKSLLHKAKVSTNVGVVEGSSDQIQGSSNPSKDLFMIPKPEQEFIPCPTLFSEVIQRPWSQPGSLAAPSGHDKNLYCSAPELELLLQLPSVVAPVASIDVFQCSFQRHNGWEGQTFL